MTSPADHKIAFMANVLNHNAAVISLIDTKAGLILGSVAVLFPLLALLDIGQMAPAAKTTLAVAPVPLFAAAAFSFLTILPRITDRAAGETCIFYTSIAKLDKNDYQRRVQAITPDQIVCDYADNVYALATIQNKKARMLARALWSILTSVVVVGTAYSFTPVLVLRRDCCKMNWYATGALQQGKGRGRHSMPANAPLGRAGARTAPACSFRSTRRTAGHPRPHSPLPEYAFSYAAQAPPCAARRALRRLCIGLERHGARPPCPNLELSAETIRAATCAPCRATGPPPARAFESPRPREGADRTVSSGRAFPSRRLQIRPNPSRLSAHAGVNKGGLRPSGTRSTAVCRRRERRMGSLPASDPFLTLPHAGGAAACAARRSPELAGSGMQRPIAAAARPATLLSCAAPKGQPAPLPAAVRRSARRSFLHTVARRVPCRGPDPGQKGHSPCTALPIPRAGRPRPHPSSFCPRPAAGAAHTGGRPGA